MSATLASATRQCARPSWLAAAHDPWRILRSLARQAEAWLQQRRRVAADRETLASMSDRELMDIGIPRGSLHAAAERAWLRDYPC